jgi:phosphoglucosamine mutase
LNKLFGTDGVRGIANEFLTPELAFALGRAGGYALAAHGDRRPVLIGRDTRCSGPMLEAALAAGICSIGLDVLLLGIVPTPAVAWLTRRQAAGAGVMISASHNPIEDNGIKFFASDGRKLSDAIEHEIADLVESASSRPLPRPTGAAVGTIEDRRRAVRDYIAHCESLGADLKGQTIVIDAAYGAAYQIGPAVFAHLGARVVKRHCAPNGKRINVRCGSTDLSSLRQAVLAHPGSFGVAFDGDADRALFIDEGGNEVTGDHVLAMRAKELLARDELQHRTVVATVMSNIGLEIALRGMGVTLLRTPVGDRYVLEEMQRGGFRLGGEQSGHIIDLASNTTGDGIATAVFVASLAAKSGGLAQIAGIVRPQPQVLVNVSVTDKTCMEREELQQVIARTEDELGANGRVLVRPSGTEPLIRVMIEGPSEQRIRELALAIAARIKAFET